MLSGKTQVALAAALAGLVLLLTRTFTPPKQAHATLPPETFAQAVATQNEPLLEASVAEHLDVNALGADGRSPLLVAVDQRDAAMVQRLLDLGANADGADSSGRTPLMSAVTARDPDLLGTLLEHSTQPDARDAEGRSAADHAIAARQVACLDLLLAANSERAAAERAAELIESACESGEAQIITAVLSRAPVAPVWRPSTRSTLTAALQANDLELTRLLLSKHAAPPMTESGTVPLLTETIATGDAKTFRALLAAGADPNVTLPAPADKQFVATLPNNDFRGYVKSDDGITPLMFAAGLGKAEYVRALLDAGADRNRQTGRFHMLPLYFAAHTRKSKVVQMLLGRGLSPDQLRVEISITTQRASVIKDGVPVLSTRVSTGRKGFDTPAGEYVVTDKTRSHISSVYHVEMPFFMRLNCLDFGLHAGAVPNYPASHGCIRLPAEIAQRLFSEIPVGTVVMIN